MSSLREQCDFMSNVVRRAIIMGMNHEQFVKLAETAWLVLTAEPASAQETPPAPPCFWCGCEKEHPDHKFGAGKNHAYRIGSVVTKEEREAYAQNR